jgi:hypothetical protein
MDLYLNFCIFCRSNTRKVGFSKKLYFHTLSLGHPKWHILVSNTCLIHISYNYCVFEMTWCKNFQKKVKVIMFFWSFKTKFLIFADFTKILLEAITMTVLVIKWINLTQHTVHLYFKKKKLVFCQQTWLMFLSFFFTLAPKWRH